MKNDGLDSDDINKIYNENLKNQALDKAFKRDEMNVKMDMNTGEVTITFDDDGEDNLNQI